MSDHPTYTQDPYAAPAAASGTATGSSGSSASSTAQSVKDGVSGTASQAADSTGQVLGTAKAETSEVISTAAQSLHGLLDQTRTELAEQAGTQHERLTKGLQSLADELDSMGEKSDQSGLGASMIKQVSQRARTTSEWMGQRDPADLLSEARQYAARKPGTFLAGAAVLGFLGARLTRGLAAAATPGSSTTPSTPAPVSPVAQPWTAEQPGARLDEGLPTVTTTSHGQPVTYTSGAGVAGSLDDLDDLGVDGIGTGSVRP